MRVKTTARANPQTLPAIAAAQAAVKAPRKRLEGQPAPRTGVGRQHPPRMGMVKKPLRLKAGIATLHELRRLQKDGELIIPTLPFHRVVREISQDISPELLGKGNYAMFERSALDALQEAAEKVMVSFFENSQLLALHGKRVTVRPRDLAMVIQVNTTEFGFARGVIGSGKGMKMGE